MSTRKCMICGRDDKNMHYIVTTKCQLICWSCVGEACDYFKVAMEESNDD